MGSGDHRYYYGLWGIRSVGTTDTIMGRGDYEQWRPPILLWLWGLRAVGTTDTIMGRGVYEPYSLPYPYIDAFTLILYITIYIIHHKCKWIYAKEKVVTTTNVFVCVLWLYIDVVFVQYYLLCVYVKWLCLLQSNLCIYLHFVSEKLFISIIWTFNSGTEHCLELQTLE